MHKEILIKEQLELLPLIKKFSNEYYLVGGTAIALHIGHRRSIDFDLFTEKELKRKQIKNIIENSGWRPEKIIYEAYDQMHLVISGVKLTFFQYPYKIKSEHNLENIINVPGLIDLAAMKAYALGGRAKWKDYVDIYFILKDHHSVKEISNKAKEIYKEFFNEKLFKEQLSWFKDIDYSESVTFIKEKPKEDEIKQFLIEAATTEF